MARLAGQQVPSILLVCNYRALGLQTCYCTQLIFFHGCWGSELKSSHLWTSTLLTETSSWCCYITHPLHKVPSQMLLSPVINVYMRTNRGVPRTGEGLSLEESATCQGLREVCGRKQPSERRPFAIYRSRPLPPRPFCTYVFPAQSGFAVFTVDVCNRMEAC